MRRTIPELRDRLVGVIFDVQQTLRKGTFVTSHTMQELLAATEEMNLAFEQMVNMTTFDADEARSLDRLIESALKLAARAQEAERRRAKSAEVPEEREAAL